MLLLLAGRVNVTTFDPCTGAVALPFEPLDLGAAEDWTGHTLTERRLLRLSRARMRRRFRRLLNAPIVVLDLARLCRW